MLNVTKYTWQVAKREVNLLALINFTELFFTWCTTQLFSTYAEVTNLSNIRDLYQQNSDCLG